MLLALRLPAIKPTRREFVPANRTLVLLRDLALRLLLLLVWLLVRLRRSHGCRERGWRRGWERGVDVEEGAVAGGGGGGGGAVVLGMLGMGVRMVAVMVVVAWRLGDVVGVWARRGVAVGGVRVGG